MYSKKPATPTGIPSSTNGWLDGALRCSACGAAGYEGDKYCACCGKAFSRICHGCGERILQPVAYYCSHCGIPLDEKK